MAGNTPFKYNAATDEWTATARTGIGHYLFVYPYNADDNNRAAVSYTLPTVQELYGADGKINLNAAVEKGNKAVSAALLTGEEDGMTISLKNLYSYPKFRVNFDNGLPITSVSQVVLEYQSGFIVKGGFNHDKVWKLFNGEEQAKVIGDDKEYKTAKEYWDDKQTKDFIITNENYAPAGQNLNGQYTTIEKSNYIVAKFPENTKVAVDGVTNNKYIDVRFMIPGELISAGTGYDESGKFNMHIYTNNGVTLLIM
ncbi:MAG: hypothetical protein LUF04_05995 [Bacteroides sp.]|nr:hypothetical protein [Bacteroides sp.]